MARVAYSTMATARGIFYCTACPKTFTVDGDNAVIEACRHLLEHPEGTTATLPKIKLGSVHQCEYCQKEFLYHDGDPHNEPQNHVDTAHPRYEQCWCGVTTTSVGAIIVHMRGHTADEIEKAPYHFKSYPSGEEVRLSL